MPEDPTKVLDALQSLVVQSRALEGALPLSAACYSVENFRTAVHAAGAEHAARLGACVDHLRRVEARGPGLNANALGAYQVELVCFQPHDPVDRLRVWRDGHLLAEVELCGSGREAAS